MSFAKDN